MSSQRHRRKSWRGGRAHNIFPKTGAFSKLLVDGEEGFVPLIEELLLVATVESFKEVSDVDAISVRVLDSVLNEDISCAVI